MQFETNKIVNMPKIDKVFDTEVLTYKCDITEFYQNKEFIDSLDLLFTFPELRQHLNDQQHGEALSTAGYNNINVWALPGIEYLLHWVKDRQIELGQHYGRPVKDIAYSRIWVNRMFKGCEGKIHDHTTQSGVEFISIFYIDVPEDSGSQLVFVKDGKLNDLESDYPEDQKYRLSPASGDFVLHAPFLPHGVSKHNSDKPRTCLVLEGVFVLEE